MENPAAQNLTDQAIETGKARRLLAAPIWVERWSVLILALATVATSWAAYQRVRWDRIERILRQEADLAATQASAANVRGYAEAAHDSAWFIRFAEAHYAGEQALQPVLADEMMRPELRPFLDRWLAADPGVNTNTPRTPFALAGYDESQLADGLELAGASTAKIEEADQAEETSDRYVASTVILTSVLFFAGLSATLRVIKARVALLAIGAVVLAAVAITLLTLPIL